MHFWRFGCSHETACGLEVWADLETPYLETPYKANPASCYWDDVTCTACLLAGVRVYGIDSMLEAVRPEVGEALNIGIAYRPSEAKPFA